MTLAFESQLSLIIKSGVDLDFLLSLYHSRCSAVVIDLLSLIMYNFYGAIVKFGKSAVNCYLNIARVHWLFLSLTSECICKHTALQV